MIDSKLQQLLDKSVKKQKIPGAVLGIANSEETWLVASGVGDLKTQQQIKPTDRFRIGSISKIFVAVVVLQLAQEEVLTLEDTIADWLSEEVSDRIANSGEITIHQLLNHSSGLPDYLYTDEFNAALVSAGFSHMWIASEALEYVYDLDPEAPPGESHSYSNTNYILLERIVEIATEKTLAQEIRDRILTPLNLENTFTERREKIPGGLVHGYTDWDGNGTQDDMLHINDGNGLGDGGLVSSAADLIEFARGLFINQSLLKPDFYQQMLEFIEDGEGNQYGLGVELWESDWGAAFGHDGLTDGFVTTLWCIPEAEAIAVVLVNDADKGDPDDIAQQALTLILGEGE